MAAKQAFYNISDFTAWGDDETEPDELAEDCA